MVVFQDIKQVSISWVVNFLYELVKSLICHGLRILLLRLFSLLVWLVSWLVLTNLASIQLLVVLVLLVSNGELHEEIKLCLGCLHIMAVLRQNL